MEILKIQNSTSSNIFIVSLEAHNLFQITVQVSLQFDFFRFITKTVQIYEYVSAAYKYKSNIF